MRISDLNPAQQKAARTTEGPVLILAGAGTGKTRTVTTRICHLLDKGVPPQAILAVTFTNKAANEMRERVAESTPKGTKSKLTISTFHSLCVKVLRADIDKLGYKKNFTIYTSGDQQGMVKKLITKYAGRDEKLKPEEAIGLWSRQRNKGIPAGTDDSLVVAVMSEYARQLKLLNAVDFDDLLVLACQVLRENADVRERWRSRFQYIMVDEFQDTNALQMELMKYVVGPHHNICVVGDDDQSIYGWRGAEIQNILDFGRFFPKPTIVTLEENYRSTNTILNAANELIKHNRDRHQKKLWSGKAAGEKVRLISMPGEKEEAELVVDEIRDRKEADNRPYEDFAILFRTNSQTRAFEEVMRQWKIPYRVVGGQSFFDKREVKDVLGYLNVLANPDDDVNLLRIINNPPRGIGETFVEQATAESAEKKEPILQTIRRPEFRSLFTTKTQNSVEKFIEMIDRYQVVVQEKQQPVWMTLEGLLMETDYIAYLRRGCKEPEEASNRETSVREVVASIRERNVKDQDELIDFLGSITLDDSRESGQEQLERKQGVSLITMHAAKGLEFPIVYLPGLEEGILPHKRSIEENTKDEERRLLYVGITRAQEQLTLTYCLTRTKWGDKVPCNPSSFIKELDERYVEWLSYNQIQSRPLDTDEADDAFERMKAMLMAE
jgi:DNA helicase II / ATP-dependent DNA helicase PcrA